MCVKMKNWLWQQRRTECGWRGTNGCRYICWPVTSSRWLSHNIRAVMNKQTCTDNNIPMWIPTWTLTVYAAVAWILYIVIPKFQKEVNVSRFQATIFNTSLYTFTIQNMPTHCTHAGHPVHWSQDYLWACSVPRNPKVEINSPQWLGRKICKIWQRHQIKDNSLVKLLRTHNSHEWWCSPHPQISIGAVL